MGPSEYEGAVRLGIATLIGLGAGVEREWSGHTTGPDARFAGVRTFTLLGLLGGVSGLLLAQGHELMTLGFVLGGVGLVVCSYVMATRRATSGIDGTTEAAALTVLALATLAGTGWVMLAAGAGSLMVLALSEKQRLHGLVRNIGDKELHAALQFSVLALVVLPLLPAGPLFGELAIKPRALWIVVLLFSALNFAGYLARHAVGPERGYGIAGALGGVVSSTAVTLNFSRQSQRDDEPGVPLARGVIAACTVLVPRVLIVSAVLSPAVALALAPRLLPANGHTTRAHIGASWFVQSSMRRMRYRDIVSDKPSPRTSRWTCRLVCARKTAACPAELPPPTTMTSSPSQTCASTNVAP